MHRPVTRHALTAVLSLFLLLTAGAATAQSPDAALTAEQQAQLQAIHAARKQMMQLEQRLTQIQEATLAANPELKAQQEGFKAKLLAAMEENGYAAEQEVAELHALEARLRAEGASDEERRALMVEFQQKAAAYQQAQRQAMESESLQQARQELSDAVLAAMKRQDPQTEALIGQLQETRQRLMALHREAVQGR